MTRWPLLLYSAALIITLYVYSVPSVFAADRGYFKGIQSTGAVWLQFGPAIFKNCKRIDWFQGRPLLKPSALTERNGSGWREMDLSKVNKLSLNNNDKNFAPLMQWVKLTFGAKLNCSPEHPVNENVSTVDGALILYDDLNASDKNWFCMPHLLTNIISGEEMYGNVLLVIPLGIDTFSYDENEQKYRMAQLTAYMKNLPQPAPELDPKSQRLKASKLKDNKNCGFIDKTGKMIFDDGDVDTIDWQVSEGLIRIKNLAGKTQFWDKSGKLAFTNYFDDALRFKEGLCGASSNGKWGYINHSGEFVIQPTFDYAQSFCDGLAAIKIGNKWGYIDKSGKLVIQPKFNYCIEFSEGLAAAADSDGVGFIDKSGLFVIKPIYAHVSSFSCGVAGVSILDTTTKKIHRLYVDKSGNKVFDYDQVMEKLWQKGEPPVNKLYKPFNIHEVTVGQTSPPKADEYDYYNTELSSEQFSEGLLPIWLGFHSAYLKLNGSVAFEVAGQNAETFSDGLAAIGIEEDGKNHWGFIDHSGKLVIPTKYFGVDQFSDGLAIVCTPSPRPDAGYDIIDKTGAVLGHTNASLARFTEGLCRKGVPSSMSELLKFQMLGPGGPM